MAGKKVGSDGQVRKTTAEWAADTATYPEGMRLMNTDTGTVRVSKGTTYALAWVPATGGGASAWGEITGTLSDQTDLQAALDAKADSSDLTGIDAPTATFSTNTNTAQDPGQDTVRFNNGTIASVTEIGLSDVVGGVDKGTLNSLCSGIIQFRLVGTTETIEFRITSVVHTSWTRYTVTYLKGALPANGTVMAVRFIPVNVVTQTITNGETTTSPSEDAVFNALAAIDLTGVAYEVRTGSAMAFDVPAVYNSAASPSSGTVTHSSSGDVTGTQIEAWFNHSSVPSWPTGFTVAGVWNNSAPNCVRFTYHGSGVYSGVIDNSATGASQTVPSLLTITGGSSISTTGTTAVALPGLSFTLPAGARRDVVIFLRVNCPAAGFRLGWWSSVGTDQLFNLYGGWGGATTEASLITSSGLNQLNASQAYIASSGSNKWLRLEGSFTGGAADSVMDLRFASVTNGQTTQIYLPSTHIMIWQ